MQFFPGDFMNRATSIFLVTAALLVSELFLPSRGTAAQAPRRMEVIAKRYSFSPAELTIKKGEPVILVLKSVDVPHGLRFRELNVEGKAVKGGMGEVQFTPEATGDFVGHCSVFCGAGHGTMTLTIHVAG